MPNVGSVFNLSSDNRKFKPSDLLVIPDAYVGVEVELERMQGLQVDNLWVSKRDGSLHDDGMEYAFAAPLLGEDIINALDELQSTISDNGITPLVSNDTSLHVHIDVRNMENIEELARFIMLYIIYEQVLFKYAGEEREYNIFCLSLDRANAEIERFSNIIHGIINNNQSAIYEYTAGFSKYGGINVASLPQFGTLEFRGHRGTYDSEEILRWINILLCLKKAATDNSIPFDKPYLAMKASGVVEFSEKIFGGYLKYLFNPGFYEQVYKGMQLARKVANGMDSTNILKECKATAGKDLISKFAESPQEEEEQLVPNPLERPTPARAPDATVFNGGSLEYALYSVLAPVDGLTDSELQALIEYAPNTCRDIYMQYNDNLVARAVALCELYDREVVDEFAAADEEI